MRVNDSKNKRMQIMEQIRMRERSREKQRKSSAERRKKIEQNLNDFMKTMSNVSFRHTGNSSGFRYEHPYSQIHGSYQELQNLKPSQKQQLIQEYNQVLRSPSFKDINLARENGSIMELSSESIKFLHYKNNIDQAKQERQQENKIDEQEISYTKRDDYEKQIQQITPNSIVQNESSASAIFFTSQFNQFISKNHLSSKQQIQSEKHTQIHQKQPFINTNSQTDLYPSDSKLPNPLQNTQDPDKPSSSQLQSLKFDHTKQPQISQLIAQSDHQINPLPQTLNDQEPKSTLIKNKSGQSLAFSNQSSLKYSLNESNIKQILNRKFTNQLIADTHQFDPFNQDSSLYHHLKLLIIAEKLHITHQKTLFKDLKKFIKTFQLSQKVKKRQKRMYFQAFIINQDIIFHEKVSQIKCDKFLQQKQQQQLKNIFESIKFTFLILPRSKIDKATKMEQKRENQIKQKIFRCLKIAWYDQKVKKEIELYYLSKLFVHFTRVIKAQKQHTRNKCLAFYCSNLKKRMFRYLKQGVDRLQSLRIQRDNASWHYSFGLQRKVFDAWKDRLSYKDRYISLAMTTKNTFRSTSDQKWLQIKTVDFKQIKYQ